ncbi:hypothetical protein EXIGLDRAFT_751329 [Exidia glandulosa HHB12029]|uniref:F-box domain-containing protein n=1 Tax=Exidia glandulosa HHB12029 TaxID=1314781 RepID=A0A165FJS3_EXIGL|nr:hypothetical protein EXIGLDRAFT_751329 [Exidia glandulosa HHB12029]
MAFPSHHHEALRASVFKTLESFAETPVLDTVDRAIASTLAVVHTAIAEFAQAWNNQHLDPLRMLPPELHTSCLRWLQLHELIAASHVSRDWRAVALAEPTLWNSFDANAFKTSRSDDSDCAEALEAMFLRSRSAPFDFSWRWGPGMSREVRDILSHSQNVQRLQSLEIFGPPNHSPAFISTLIGQPMLQLRRLVVTGLGAPIQFPDVWNDITVPRLQFLGLGETIFPERLQAISSVTKLSLSAPLDCRYLFELFPRVENVLLQNVSTSNLLPRELGTSVTSYSLTSGSRQEDHSLSLLEQGRGWRLVPYMTIESTNVLRPLEWFTSRIDGGWRMQLHVPARLPSVSVTLEKESHGRLAFNMKWADFFTQMTVDLLPPFTANLTALVINEPAHTLPVVAAMTMPNLRTLGLTLGDYAAIEWILDIWLHPSRQPIFAPALREFMLTTTHATPSKATKLIQVVPVLFHLTGRLERLKITSYATSILRDADLSFAWNFCDSIRLTDFEKDLTFDLSASDSLVEGG